jgi:pimeloyl-ACP methyl ester carboxylesterase
LSIRFGRTPLLGGLAVGGVDLLADLVLRRLCQRRLLRWRFHRGPGANPGPGHAATAQGQRHYEQCPKPFHVFQFTRADRRRKSDADRGTMSPMPRGTPTQLPMPAARARRGYFECRYGQLHVHHAMPRGGGFEEGTPLLCLHDLPGSGRVFTRLLPLAGEDRSVYAPDLPGFGESDGPAARPTMHDYAAALGDFIDSLRLRTLAVLGLRAGAVPATELALTRPTQVSRVILVSVPLLTEAERQAARSQMPAPTDGAFSSGEAARWVLEAAAQYPLRERLARLTQRLLVLRSRDELYEATGRVREVLPAARVAELQQNATEVLACAPQRIAEAAREFLRS